MKFLIPMVFLLLTHCEQLFTNRYPNPPPVPNPNTLLYPNNPNNPNSPHNPNAPTAQTNQSTLIVREGPWGVIKCGSSDPNEMKRFQEAVRKFLSTKIDPSSLGVFSCISQSPGGVFVRGSVVLPEEQAFDLQSREQFIYIRPSGSTSYMEIHFEPATGTTPTPISLTLSYGQVNGQVINLTFEDHAGEISLDGHVKNRIFSGVLKFNNFHTWDGKSPGYSDILGAFSIPICQLMPCKT